MLISNYYRGGTERLSGFIYDTEKKTYKEYSLKANEWSHEYEREKDCGYGRKVTEYLSGPLPDFKDPADISYYFNTKSEMEIKLHEIQRLGFTEDTTMVLDFGTIVK